MNHTTNPQDEFTAKLAERSVEVRWPDNERGGATPPADDWQDRAWSSQPTLHQIDEGSITGCSVLRWRDDPRPDAELLALSLALVTGQPPVVSVPPPADRATLLAAADVYDKLLADMGEATAQDPRYWMGVQHVVVGLRRLAAEGLPLAALDSASVWGQAPPKGFNPTPAGTADGPVLERLCTNCKPPIAGQDDLVDHWLDRGLITPEQHAAFDRSA